MHSFTNQEQSSLPIYFLTPKLVDPVFHKASGGTISNLRMIEGVSDFRKVICIPMLLAGVPASLREKQNVVLDLPYNHGTGRIRYLIERYMHYRRRVEEAIKRHGNGVLLSTRAAIPVAYQIASKLEMPLVIVTRAFEDLEQAGLRSYSDKQTVFRRLEGFLHRDKIIAAYHESVLVITNSEYMKWETRRLFDIKIPFHVAYPPMDLPCAAPDVRAIRKIGFVNKGIRKGSALVLELARLMPGKQFMIFGEQLEQRNSGSINNIENMGYQKDRRAMFESVDLFLVPSVWDEPFGRVAAEAIWTGTPVIVSRRGGLPEAAPNELFWEESDNPARWREKILALENSVIRNNFIKAIMGAQDRLASYAEDEFGELCRKLDEHFPIIECDSGLSEE